MSIAGSNAGRRWKPRSLLRRALAVGACFCLASSPRLAGARDSQIELAGFAGYQLGASAEGASNLETLRAEIAPSPSYGMTIDLRLISGAFAELSYTQQPTDVSVRSSNGSSERYDLTVHYLQLGGLTEFRVPAIDFLRPIVGATAGATVYHADEADYDFDEWRLSLLLEGGVKLRILEALGLRLRARLLTTFLTSGSALLCGSQGSCVATFSGTAVFQGELGAGLYIAF